MIIKLAGANGSGKSTLARAFIKHWNLKPVTWPGKSKIKLYQARIAHPSFKQAVVLGDYTNACGGMDGVSNKDVRLAMVAEYTTRQYKSTLLLFEGVLLGVTYGAMGELSERSAVPWLYAFLTTPYEECVRRVEQRRQAKGNHEPFDGMKSLYPKIRACASVARRAEAAGHATLFLDYQLAPETQVKILMKKVEKLQ